jgi:hypothetical protein
VENRLIDAVKTQSPLALAQIDSGVSDFDAPLFSYYTLGLLQETVQSLDPTSLKLCRTSMALRAYSG